VVTKRRLHGDGARIPRVWLPAKVGPPTTASGLGPGAPGTPRAGCRCESVALCRCAGRRASPRPGVLTSAAPGTEPAPAPQRDGQGHPRQSRLDQDLAGTGTPQRQRLSHPLGQGGDRLGLPHEGPLFSEPVHGSRRAVHLQHHRGAGWSAAREHRAHGPARPMTAQVNHSDRSGQRPAQSPRVAREPLPQLRQHRRQHDGPERCPTKSRWVNNSRGSGVLPASIAPLTNRAARGVTTKCTDEGYHRGARELVMGTRKRGWVNLFFTP
jgi:hypothetical protein